MNIGENIKTLREKNYYTQEQLAERVGVSRSMIAQIERGTKAVSLVLSKEIAETLNCSIYELLKDK